MIVCTGPMGSGTKLLFEIVRDDFEFGDYAWHASMPSGPDGVPSRFPEPVIWWKPQDFPTGSRFVIIHRRPDVTVQSLMHRDDLTHIPKDEPTLRAEHTNAMGLLAAIPNAYWLSYEALVIEPRQQLDNLANWLGCTSHWRSGIRDENAKWL